MSESKPPHLPRARAGRIHGFQVIPVTPSELFDSAPMIPETRVPCHELFEAPQLVNGPLLALLSADVTQSPGSVGSESRPLPSFAIAACVMKS